MAIDRIAVFGGTFDPIHNGHIAVARCLTTELEADLVIIVPAGRPWLRGSSPVASPEDRLNMVRSAADGVEGIDVSDVDVVRAGTTYSIDTIDDLRAIYGDTVEYFLVIGSDTVPHLTRWHRYDELIQACSFAVVQRPGAMLKRDVSLPIGAALIDGPMIDVSASQVRAMYANGDLDAASQLVPIATHRFIIEEGLYR